jgi:hypothetical protein
MKLWLVSQEENDNYDTFDSFVVAAETEQEAKFTHPSKRGESWDGKSDDYDTWAPVEYVKVALIGEAAEGVSGIICASFNAG